MPRRLTWLATVVGCLVLGTAPAAATLTITGAAVPGVPPIRHGFVGLSVEYPALPHYIGTDPRHVDPVFEQLLRSLSPGGSPSVRIGGISTDKTWWPISQIAQPRGVTFTLTPAWLAVTRAFVRDIGARTILGVNLEAGQPLLAATEARALIAGIGRSSIVGMEIGNEPTNYPWFPWYRVGHRLVYARPHSYRFSDFVHEVSAIRRRLPGVPLAGPALAGYGWLVHLGAFLNAEPGLTTVTFHRYPLNRCFPGPGSPARATLRNLLAPFASGGFIAPARPYVALAHASGARFRLDEFNSVSCSGKVGLSDIFASALWATDTLFEVANDGIDGVNVHTFPGAPYAPFDVSRVGAAWSAVVHPEYYGLLLFIRAAPPGARLLTVSGRTPAGVRIWATRGPGRTVHVVVINKNAGAPYRAVISVRRASGAASVQRLLAPGLHAKDGVTLGGQRVTTPSLSGQLTGPPSSEVVRPRAGQYAVTVAAASAALLTVAVSR